MSRPFSIEVISNISPPVWFKLFLNGDFVTTGYYYLKEASEFMDAHKAIPLNEPPSVYMTEPRHLKFRLQAPDSELIKLECQERGSGRRIVASSHVDSNNPDIRYISGRNFIVTDLQTNQRYKLNINMNCVKEDNWQPHSHPDFSFGGELVELGIQQGINWVGALNTELLKPIEEQVVWIQLGCAKKHEFYRGQFEWIFCRLVESVLWQETFTYDNDFQLRNKNLEFLINEWISDFSGLIDCCSDCRALNAILKEIKGKSSRPLTHVDLELLERVFPVPRYLWNSHIDLRKRMYEERLYDLYYAFTTETNDKSEIKESVESSVELARDIVREINKMLASETDELILKNLKVASDSFGKNLKMMELRSEKVDEFFEVFDGYCGDDNWTAILELFEVFMGNISEYYEDDF